MADKKFLDEDGVSQFAEETKKYIDKHIDNADIHVTATDKANWNGKQDALTAEQLAAVNSGINAIDKGNYDAHVANADIHVTTADKSNWNGKQDALTSQQIDNINDVVNKANASDLTAHTDNADIHVTADDKNVWDGKQNALTAQQLSNIADVINKANDADVVHKRGNETVNGTKTFTVGPVSSNDATTNGFFIKNTAIARNDVPTTLYHSTFRVNDKNNQILGEYCVEKSNSGSSLLNMNVRTEKDDGTQIAKSLYLNLRNDGSDVSFYPSTNNEFSLGTSTSKWKDVNTVLLNGKTPAYADDLSNYLPLSGGQMTGSIKRNVNNSWLVFAGGTDTDNGASLWLYGKDQPTWSNQFFIGTAANWLIGKPDGSLTWGNKPIDTIEEQGDGYIRYSSGIQICWGFNLNISNVEQGITQINFAKSFSKEPSVAVNITSPTDTLYYACQAHEITTTYFRAYCYLVANTLRSPDQFQFSWQAIGYWK